ncbi:MAG TPA: organomercurial lyase [Candidatus Dormibacteraeota bacterium]|nr:organomercurial lyase [Candidatus Dormibacteraeota bacterium]
MTMQEIAAALDEAMPKLDATDKSIAVAVRRLIGEGAAAPVAQIARAAGVSAGLVERRLASWPGVYRNAKGDVAGFWGHAIAPLDPEYRLRIDGKTTYAWCALDTLFIPGLIGRAVRVEANDPVTGQPVSLTVDGNGVRDLEPASAVVSMVGPDGPFGYDVIESFCHRVFFFASPESGQRWTSKHEGTLLISVPEAFELGRRFS